GLTATITGTVDAATVGSYKLSYNVTDTAGNQAVEITRTVNVVDTTAPLITLNGESSVLVAHGGIYVEPGATITENVDTGLTSTVTGSVDTATLGDHVLTYNASDTAGNVADTKTRTVTVVDQTAPVITLIGDDPLILAHRATFTDAGTTVSDNIDIGLTTTVTGVVDTFTAGDYALTYNVSDAAGNEASAVTRTVTVSPSAHKIVAGYYDTCVYTDDDKELRCWGYNSGAHGSGHTESVGDEVEDMGAALIPTMLPDVELLDFAIGEEFGCGIFADKTTRCWGDNDTGQLGKGATGDALTEVQLGEALVPVDLGDDLYAVEIHANDYDTVCVLLNNGRIKCWGSEHSFTLGIPTDSHIGLTAESMGNNLLPIDFGINPDTNLPYKATTMSMDYYTACAALENGKVKCWGSNESGNLGLGEAEVYPFSSIGGNSGDMGDNLAYALLGDINVVKLITNYTATCALTDDNRMKCWGYNSNGQLGSNDSDDRGNGHDDSTNSLKYLDKVSQVFDIRELNAANDGSTLCPGAPDNKGVQLVYGNDDGIPSGTALDQILDDGEIDTNIVKCDTAELTAFAVEDLSYSSTTSDKLAYGLKASDYSEMGDNLPFVDLGTTDVIKKMAIGYAITCALFETGKVKCWGSHYSNGADLPDNIGHAPEHSVAVANYVDLGTTDKVVDIAAGGYQTCVVFETAKVKCWGYSDYGELGLPQLSGNIGDGDPEPEMGENLPYVDFR
ncbi:MAG: DUF5011 domain-containing protein, partial [Alteromonadales bacterium]|nr:DUF5011 domain-containing protein [Alteromonadales bacterium]